MIRKWKHHHLRQICDEQDKISWPIIWPLHTTSGDYERPNKEAKSDYEALDEIQQIEWD